MCYFYELFLIMVLFFNKNYPLYRPQDDFALASWRMGETVPTNDTTIVKDQHLRGGLTDHDEWIEQCLDYTL